jgi:hypothetical protein
MGFAQGRDAGQGGGDVQGGNPETSSDLVVTYFGGGASSPLKAPWEYARARQSPEGTKKAKF